MNVATENLNYASKIIIKLIRTSEQTS